MPQVSGVQYMPHVVMHYLPELDEPERTFIERLTAGMSHETIQQFAAAYRQVRKDPQTLRVMAIIGIVAVPGLHRFWVGQIGIGFLYLLTWGLLLFGTISDIIKYRDFAFAYNQRIAKRIATNLIYGGIYPSNSGGEPFRPGGAVLSQTRHSA
jgi:TM2 domain-containing membrane protein YozV